MRVAWTRTRPVVAARVRLLVRLLRSQRSARSRSCRHFSLRRPHSGVPPGVPPAGPVMTITRRRPPRPSQRSRGRLHPRHRGHRGHRGHPGHREPITRERRRSPLLRSQLRPRSRRGRWGEVRGMAGRMQVQLMQPSLPHRLRTPPREWRRTMCLTRRRRLLRRRPITLGSILRFPPTRPCVG
jgi:hypothetical protein